MNSTPSMLLSQFEREYGQQPSVVAFSPGRVNLIGEHTDYNHGFVFPAAINYGTWVAASLRADNEVNAVALDYHSSRSTFSLSTIVNDEDNPWADYVRGVIKELTARYPQMGGANLMITGNVPTGAGLSSSASFEVAVAKAMSDLYSLQLDGKSAAIIGQSAENHFVGCSCGIMDQLVSALGKKGQAMLLDCHDLSHQHIPLPESHNLMIINSNVKRGLVDSEYNLRRQQCEAGASALGVPYLRYATMAMLVEAQHQLSDVVYRRARHIISENTRTLATFDALKTNDIAALSQLMAESHISMRDDFEITVPQIDYIVEIVQSVVGEAGGVRMTGGGFGGSVVALIPKNYISEVTNTLDAHYHAHTGLKQTIYNCTAENGGFA